MRSFFLCVAWVLSSVFMAAAQDAAEVKAIQDKVKSIVLAIQKEDSKAILDLTHPKVLEMAGGRAALEAALGGAFKQWKELGMKITVADFPAAPTFHQGTENEFVIVPTHSVITVAGKTVDSTQFQLGARKKGEAKWTYVDGSKLNKAMILQLFPDFPPDVETPEKTQKVSQ